MKLNFTALKPNNLLNLRIYAKGWLSLLMVLGLATLLATTLFRVFVSARSNVDVYNYEVSALDKIRNDNSDLKSQLQFYQSYEYKMLYARDYLHLAEPGERLYRIVGKQTIYDINTPTQDLVADDQYANWWLMLVKM